MKNYDKNIDQLLKLYEDSEQRLIQIITKKTVKGQVTDFYESLLKQVQLELLKTQIASVGLSDSIVKDLYKEAYEKAKKGIGADISAGYTRLHTRAINIIINNLVNNFAEVNNLVGRQIEDTVRKIGLTKAATKFATGQTIKQMQKELQDQLVKEGIGGIIDKRGRTIPYTTYSNILCRSIVAETQNTCILNVASEHNHDLVKMSYHKTSCEVCQPLENKVYSISGKSDKYPALNSIEGFKRGYNNIHPRCRHRLKVWIEKYNRDPKDPIDPINKVDPKETKKPKEEAAAKVKAADNKATDFESAIYMLSENNIDIEVGSLKQIDEKLMVNNSNKLVELIGKYPLVEEYINNKQFSFSAEKLNPLTNAVCGTNLSVSNIFIKLNTTRFKSFNDVVEKAYNNSINKWSMPHLKENSDTYAITHEFGHAIHNVMIDHYNQNNVEEFEKARERMNRAKTLAAGRKVIDKWRSNVVKAANNEIVKIAKSIDKDFDKLESISEYGKSSPYEFFAECFVNAEGGKPNTLGEAMKIYLDREFNNANR